MIPKLTYAFHTVDDAYHDASSSFDGVAEQTSPVPDHRSMVHFGRVKTVRACVPVVLRGRRAEGRSNERNSTTRWTR